jgi:hypothetical protein
MWSTALSTSFSEKGRGRKSDCTPRCSSRVRSPEASFDSAHRGRSTQRLSVFFVEYKLSYAAISGALVDGASLETNLCRALALGGSALHLTSPRSVKFAAQMSALGQKQTSRQRPVRIMSVLPPIAEIRQCRWDVRKVPLADMRACRVSWHRQSLGPGRAW